VTGVQTCALPIYYPEPARSAVLDYLFKPDFGASLQQLKVEIGGDVNSTDGTEPAHARTREEFRDPGAERFNRGYEWWLMKEAKRRNPGIKLDVLQWGAPPWIGEEEVKHIDPSRRLRGARDFTTDPEGKTVVRKQLGDREFRFLSRDNAEFIADFIQGAKKHHGLEIDFCGVWNEVTYEPDWIKLLRRTLDAKGLSSVKIVAVDIASEPRWGIAGVLLEDAELCQGGPCHRRPLPRVQKHRRGPPDRQAALCQRGSLHRRQLGERDQVRQGLQPELHRGQIGRASCRERGEIAGVGGTLKAKAASQKWSNVRR